MYSKITIIAVTVICLSRCSNADDLKAKELELREREVELRERELEQERQTDHTAKHNNGSYSETSTPSSVSNHPYVESEQDALAELYKIESRNPLDYIFGRIRCARKSVVEYNY